MRPTACTAWIAVAMLLGAGGAWAADPQPYRLDLADTGDSALNDALKATSELQQLRDSAPVAPAGLIARARGDIDRLKTVLESFGYYQGSDSVTINKMGLDDPTLMDKLTALPKGTDARVRISFSLGPLYHLRTIHIDGTVPADAHAQLHLDSGAPAVAAQVLAAGTALQAALQNAGYAFAAVDPPIALADDAAQVLDLSFHVAAGQKVHLGAIRIVGLKEVHETLPRQRLRIQSGDLYDARRIERARQRLLDLGLFTAVSVRAGDKPDGQGRVPLTFRVRERPRHAMSFTAAYSSDLGGSGGVNWTDRNLFGNGEQLSLSAAAINLGGSAAQSLGYDFKGQFTRPDPRRDDQSQQLNLEALQQSLQAYDQTAVISGVVINRVLAREWRASAGLSAVRERILQEGERHDYTLLSVPLTLAYNGTRVNSPLRDATHGLRATLTVTPTESFGQPNAIFVVTQLSAASFFDFTPSAGRGRRVLAVRGLVGRAIGAGEYGLPPDQRFYGGGSATLRGYRYQSVGPQFKDGNPQGGTAIDAGTVEWRQRFGERWGGVLFADAAQVGTGTQPFAGALMVGVGAGVRFYTPVGPIRLDVAVPTQRRSTPSRDDAFELYIGLGQAF